MRRQVDLLSIRVLSHALTCMLLCSCAVEYRISPQECLVLAKAVNQARCEVLHMDLRRVGDELLE